MFPFCISDLREYFTGYFPDIEDIDWTSWYYKPGMPDYKPEFDRSLVLACWKVAEKWLQYDQGHLQDSDFSPEDLTDLTAPQVQEFLSYLLQKPAMKVTTVQKMDEVYRLSESLNCEILFHFLRLGLRARWEPAVEKTLGFLKTMGRLKFVRPLYRDLARWEEKKGLAIDFFTINKHLLMSMVTDGVMKDLHI